MEEAAAFGVEDHAEGGAVFDGAAGVEEFKLGEERGGVGGREAAELKEGRVADEGSDVGRGAEGGRRACLGHRTLQSNSGQGRSGQRKSKRGVIPDETVLAATNSDAAVPASFVCQRSVQNPVDECPGQIAGSYFGILEFQR